MLIEVFRKGQFRVKYFAIGIILISLHFSCVPSAYGESNSLPERTALFEDDPLNLQKKLPIVLSAEAFAAVLSGLNYFDWGRYYAGGFTGAFGLLLIMPNTNTEYYSAYQDLGQRIAGTLTGVLLVGLSTYILTTEENNPTNRVRNVFLGYQLALTPLMVKMLFF